MQELYAKSKLQWKSNLRGTRKFGTMVRFRLVHSSEFWLSCDFYISVSNFKFWLSCDFYISVSNFKFWLSCDFYISVSNFKFPSSWYSCIMQIICAVFRKQLTLTRWWVHSMRWKSSNVTMELLIKKHTNKIQDSNAMAASTSSRKQTSTQIWILDLRLIY
jgi:hypothetical protein